jgi:hypothetical protein
MMNECGEADIKLGKGYKCVIALKYGYKCVIPLKRCLKKHVEKKKFELL